MKREKQTTRKSKVFCIAVICTICTAYGQVGIGEDTPTAALEVKGTDTGIPTLHLQPQSSVTGTSSGQMAVIDDILYTYDALRGKWLSVETTVLTFGLAGAVDGQDLEYIGDVELSGPMMPFDGTVVYASAIASSGQSDKVLFIDVYSDTNNVTPVISAPAQLVDYKISNNLINVDFNKGYFAKVRASAAGDPVNDIMFKIWVKWRKNNP